MLDLFSLEGKVAVVTVIVSKMVDELTLILIVTQSF
jgi:hypothetical protein